MFNGDQIVHILPLFSLFLLIFPFPFPPLSFLFPFLLLQIWSKGLCQDCRTQRWMGSVLRSGQLGGGDFCGKKSFQHHVQSAVMEVCPDTVGTKILKDNQIGRWRCKRLPGEPRGTWVEFYTLETWKNIELLFRNSEITLGVKDSLWLFLKFTIFQPPFLPILHKFSLSLIVSLSIQIIYIHTYIHISCAIGKDVINISTALIVNSNFSNRHQAQYQALDIDGLIYSL